MRENDISGCVMSSEKFTIKIIIFEYRDDKSTFSMHYEKIIK